MRLFSILALSRLLWVPGPFNCGSRRWVCENVVGGRAERGNARRNPPGIFAVLPSLTRRLNAILWRTTTPSTGATALTGKEKKEYEIKKIMRLGGKAPKNIKTPIKILQGMRKKESERAEKKKQEAIQTGMHMKKKSGKRRPPGPKDKGMLLFLGLLCLTQRVRLTGACDDPQQTCGTALIHLSPSSCIRTLQQLSSRSSSRAYHVSALLLSSPILSTRSNNTPPAPLPVPTTFRRC